MEAIMRSNQQVTDIITKFVGHAGTVQRFCSGQSVDQPTRQHDLAKRALVRESNDSATNLRKQAQQLTDGIAVFRFSPTETA